MKKDKNIATDPQEPKQPKKWLALITYAVAVVCLLLGLLLPLSNVAGTGVENMLIMQLPGAAGSLFNMPEWLTVGSFYTYAYPFSFLGLLETPFDLGSVFVLLYALVTLAALIGLIPVIVSKKTSKTAIKTASVIEVCALVILSVLMFMQLTLFCLGGGAIQFSYSLLVAFGGTLICLIIQTFADKKGSGAIKFVCMLLSGIATFLIIFPTISLLADVAFLKDGLYGITGSMEGVEYAGSHGTILSLFTLVTAPFTLAGSAAAQTISVITLIVGLLVLINFVLDVMGMGKKTNAFMLASNLIRYALEVAALIIMFVVTFFIEGVTAGILLYVLLAIAVIQLVISIVRYVILAKARKAANPEKAAAHPSRAARAGYVATPSTHEQRRAERRAQREAELAERAAKEAEENAAQSAAEGEEAPAPEQLYDGPVDDFIRKLNNYERKEFYAVFLERSRGNLTNVPDYIVGGNNSKFFSTVFIYYGRVRALVSDGLLNKLYEQAHVMD